MSKTFLELTNRVLVRLNEVPLTVDNFETARGIHAFAKDAVLDTIQRINKEFYQWPFDAVTQTQVLTVGVGEYAFPSNYRTADWFSFEVLNNSTLNVLNDRLPKVEREQYYDYARDRDKDNILARAKPNFIYETFNGGFGVSPVPDKTYSINYTYFKHPIAPSLPTDLCNIPENYEYIIIDGAMFHMKIFKEDVDGANLYDAKYKEGVRVMRSIYGRKWDSISDRRLSHSYTRGFGYGRGY